MGLQPLACDLAVALDEVASTVGMSATVSSVTLSRASEIITQQSLTSMRSPSISKAHERDAEETRQ